MVAVVVMVPLDLDAGGGSCGGETASSNLHLEECRARLLASFLSTELRCEV